MFMLSTRNGIVTFNTKEEYDIWMKTGMNRFQVLGQLEEIEVIEPAPYAFKVWAVSTRKNAVQFFETEQEAVDYVGEESLTVFKFTKEV